MCLRRTRTRQEKERGGEYLNGALSAKGGGKFSRLSFGDMKVFHDGDEKDIDTEEENDKDKKSTLRAIPTSSRAITKRMSDGDGITPAQTVRSTAVATTDGEKKKDEETSANDGEERETTTRKMSGVSLENDKENMTTIRSDTSRNDRVPLAAHAFYGMNITSSRGAVDNVAKNAWKVQKENASLKFTLHQMRHEMACMQSVRICISQT